MGGRWVVLDQTRKLEAIHDRHFEISDYDVGLMLKSGRSAFGPISGFEYFETGFRKLSPEHGAGELTIIDHKHSCWAHHQLPLSI
jgi:hypothetical protein